MRPAPPSDVVANALALMNREPFFGPGDPLINRVRDSVRIKEHSMPRSRLSSLRAAIVVVGTYAVASVSQAALVAGSLSFSATGFPAGAPVDPVVGTVTFSFDNTATFFNATNGTVTIGAPLTVSFSGLSLPGSWTPVLTYVSDGLLGGVQVHDLLSIGHILNGTQTIAGTEDWRVAFNDFSSRPAFREFTYTRTLDPTAQFQTFTGAVTAVPEPETMALMGVGLAAVAAWRRRKTR